jgi:tripartite-type tricarboxylate transporter receptor subunit TctC
MKKILCMIFVAMLATALCFATGGREAGGAEWPERGRTISLIVPFAPGGGMDMSGRLLSPFLEKHLGVTVTVHNIAGANGWTGWTQAIRARPDGYTLVYANYPAQIAGYLDPATNIPYTFRDFTPISLHVTDENILVLRPNDTRFRTAADFVAHARANEVTMTTGGRLSDDHFLIEKVNSALRTRIRPVHMQNTPEGFAAVLGGHVDGQIANVSEYFQRLNAGEVIVLAQFYPRRSPHMPNIPTFGEAGFPGIYGDSSRGLLAPPNLDPAVKEKLLRVIRDVMTDPEHVAAANRIGATINPIIGDDFGRWLQEQEDAIRILMPSM